MKTGYFIEDRTKRDPATSMAGWVIVWEVVTEPIPARLFRWKYRTRAES